ncbi:MAG TPA: hypothetical protein V6D21_18945 [Candidatus Obscuribacterales bacterium]
MGNYEWGITNGELRMGKPDQPDAFTNGPKYVSINFTPNHRLGTPVTTRSTSHTK